MKMLRLYGRVLGLLGPQIGQGWLLAVANVALAIALFAEPVLFGRIIDTLPARKTTRERLTGRASRRSSPPGSASACS
jgi:ATP-binding cassette subfamily B protein